MVISEKIITSSHFAFSTAGLVISQWFTNDTSVVLVYLIQTVLFILSLRGNTLAYRIVSWERLFILTSFLPGFPIPIIPVALVFPESYLILIGIGFLLGSGFNRLLISIYSLIFIAMIFLLLKLESKYCNQKKLRLKALKFFTILSLILESSIFLISDLIASETIVLFLI